MPDAAYDPYTVRHGESHAPPTSLRGRLKYLGPSLIVTGAVIGSGELVLTTSLGAVAGWALLWWILLSCWCKSLVQAEMARYTIVSGDTLFTCHESRPRAHLDPLVADLVVSPRLCAGDHGFGRDHWWCGPVGFLFSCLLANITVSGIVCTGLIAVSCSLLLSLGSYQRLERTMLALVIAFTFATLVCSIAMQFTEFRASPAEILGGMTPDWALFVSFAALALAAYGYTGTTSGDISSYTYWCIEKGYPSYVGADRDDPDWEAHGRGWMKVLHTDVWLALIIVTCATIPYYVLGAGVLNKMGLTPEGNDETIGALSNIFTQTLGPWAVWIFSIGAFFILFSTVLSGVAAGGRFIPDYLIEMQLLDRSKLNVRKAITRWYVGGLPIVAFLIYLFIPNFVVLIMIGGLTSALFLPLQCGATIWLQATKMDQRIRPSKTTQIALWVIFCFELLMAIFVIWFVVLAPFRG